MKISWQTTTWALSAFIGLSSPVIVVHGFLPTSSHHPSTVRYNSILQAEDNNNNNNNNNNEAWDADVEYDKEWPQQKATPDPSTAWDAIPNMPAVGKLGIGVSLQPLNDKEVADIRKEAEDIINSRIDESIQDIERLRKKMSKDMEQSRKIMQIASDLEAKQKSEELMKKIDQLTGNFLESTKTSRTSTKMAAAASRAMEGTGRGIEMGTWGTLSGRTVLASDSGSLLGSVDNAVKEEKNRNTSGKTADGTTIDLVENRIIVVADIKEDSLAKRLVPILTKSFQDTDIPNCKVDILPPTGNMPLGGNNAACVIVFCTSLTQASSLSSILDKLLRKTLQPNGHIGQPPTQLVGISTLGTERTNQFPYSVGNFLGKLDQRRQIEEVLINTVRRRLSEPPLDYTLIKFGEVKPSAKNFELLPGDKLDDATTVETVSNTIVQAVAYQPFARNRTLSVSGILPSDIDENSAVFWDTAFLCLEGPEVWRIGNVGDISQYGKLLEYIQGWAEILADTGKGLTTPVRAIKGITSRSSHLVEKQDGVQLLFLPTKTGKNYMSKDEERQRETDTGRRVSGVPSSSVAVRKTIREGGIDIVVETTKDQKLRVRARRCNYADDAIIKELSEATILKRLQDAMEVWKKEVM